MRAGKRKSLARALGDLFKVPMQLLPFYARIAATLSQQFPEMGRAVVAAALQAFRSAMKAKDATLRTLEPRLRAARYISELCKFRIADAGAVAPSPTIRLMHVHIVAKMVPMQMSEHTAALSWLSARALRLWSRACVVFWSASMRGCKGDADSGGAPQTTFS